MTTIQNIKGFRGAFDWLSNFYPCRLELNGIVFRSVEHAYQALKFEDPARQRYIAGFTSPADAKRAAALCPAREDWEEVRAEVMRDLLVLKFSREPFRAWLLETGDAYLEETNYWGDRFWGVCGGQGENVLGRLIMEIRSDLREVAK